MITAINPTTNKTTFGTGTTIINAAGKENLYAFLKESVPSFYIYTRGLKNGCSSMTIFRMRDNKIEKELLSKLKETGYQFVHIRKKINSLFPSKKLNQIIDNAIRNKKFTKSDINQFDA